MTVVLPPGTDLRDCHLYRFWVRHPLTGERVLGYVGETVRLPFVRLMEHMFLKPWADTILAWEVDDVVYSGKQAVLEAEALAIATELPLYNYEHNLNNPGRVEIWRAKQQRANRDAERGRRGVRPVGYPSTPVSAIHLLARAFTVRVKHPREWAPWQQKVALWTLSWLLSTSVTWGAIARLAVLPSTGHAALSAAVLSTVALLWSLLHKPRHRRRR